jgi:hypothetical protein
MSALILGAGSISLSSQQVKGEEGKGDDDVLVVDVAVDFTTYMQIPVVGPPPLNDSLRGTTFIVNGKIFPAGTISGPGFDPKKADSIGDWVCRGVNTKDGAAMMPGVSEEIDTTQMFLLPNDTKAIWTEGFEGDQGVTEHRAVIGGTGAFHGATGTVIQQTLIGLNSTGGPNSRFTFRLKRH